MKFSKRLVLSFFTIISVNAFAQTSADSIISNYFTAIGGRDKVAAIKSVVIDGTMDAMGNQSPSTITIINGKGYKSQMSFQGQDIIQCITDQGGWMINPFMGSSDAAAMPTDQYNMVKDEIYIGGELMNYKSNGTTVNFTGMDNVDGKPVYKINVSKDSATSTYYIDSATHLLDERSVTAGGQTTTSKYSNYKQTDAGVMMAYSEEITIPQGMTINYTVNKFDFSKPVDASAFEMPKK